MDRTALDPEARDLLDALEAEGGAPLESLPVAEGRETARIRCLRLGEAEQVARVEELACPGPAGPVRLRVYRPAGHGPRPALLHFHGGGWTVCDLDTHDHISRAVARSANAVVVAVDYRLAPEHPFPAAVDDCYAATRWAAENASELGIDPSRIAVGGDSAGGNLATVVALKCRDEGGPALALQVLIYPVTNLASFDTPSYREYAEGFGLTKTQMGWFAALYCPDPKDRRHPYVSPLLAPDLRGLPPALVITAECDVLRDEAEDYARRLEQAGVPVTCARYPGMIHAFTLWQGVLSQGRKSVEQICAAVAALHNSAVPASHASGMQ